MKVLAACLLAGVCFVASSPVTSNKRVVCYFASWTVYRPGNGKFDAPDVDPTLCTHVMFSFVGLNETDGSLQVLDDWEANGLHGIENLMAKKQQNPALKVYVSMGGWNEGETSKYSNVAADSKKRATMIQTVLNYIRQYSFDGFDLDWEYPCQRAGREEDKQNFVTLLKELKTALQAEGKGFSAAVAGAGFSIDASYDVPGVIENLDFINVMAYDFHGAFDNYVGHVAPLYLSHLDVTERAKDLSVVNGIEHWINKGADPAKINLGVVLYARTFTLQNPNNASLYAPISGGGKVGPYTGDTGILGYNEICEFYSDMPVVWDDEQQVPHKLKGNQWYGYENEKSLKLKVEFAKSKGLGGIMAWSLDTDDFRGSCGNVTYPLLRAINEALRQ